MKIKSILIYLFAFCLTVSISAEEKFIIGGIDGLEISKAERSYPILLALSGGGARGLTIIGILKAFEERNIEIVGIAGTSMGGIIGGLYSAGYSPEEIETFADQLNFNNLFSNAPPRKSMFLTKREENEKHLFSLRFDKFRPIMPKALTTGQELTSLLTKLTTKANYKCGADFSKLPIPYLTISTDIVSGEQVIMQRGSIAEAMRATMAFPLAFTGVEIDGRILMDGGMVTPIPVELARTLSTKSQFVVAVNTSSKLAKKEDILNPVDIANQVTSIMTADKLEAQLDKADFILQPPIDAYLASHFNKKDSLIAIGYRYGIEQADKIISQVEKNQHSTICKIGQIRSTSIPADEIKYLTEKLQSDSLSHEKLKVVLKDFVTAYNYFTLQVSIEDNITDSTEASTKILILDGYKNFLSKVIHIEFTGNTLFTDSELAQLFQVKSSLVTSTVIKAGIQKVLDLYESQGYDLVNINSISIDKENAVFHIMLDEAKIRTIDVSDNLVTKDWFIRSYFPLKKDDLYSTKRASEGIRNIYGTDLFERVTVDATYTNDGVIVHIKVKEKYSSRLRLGWHWDNEYDSEEFLEILNDNFGGIGLEYKLHAQYAPRRSEYYFSLKADRIFKSYLTSQMKIYKTDLNRQTFNLDNTPDDYRDETIHGFKLTIGQQIERLGTVTANLSVEEVELYDHKLKTTTSFGLRKLIFESLFENFDKLPFPNSGNRHRFSIEFAGRLVGGDSEFNKFYTSHETYISFGNSFNYHPHLALGASRSGLPLSEKFCLGGYDSFTGFRTDQLSGDKMFIFSNELRIKLPFRLYFTARYDLGEVYNSFDQIKLRNLRNSVGASLALDSPLGPFTFGYGYVKKDLDEVYLHLGFKF